MSVLFGVITTMCFGVIVIMSDSGNNNAGWCSNDCDRGVLTST